MKFSEYLGEMVSPPSPFDNEYVKTLTEKLDKIKLNHGPIYHEREGYCVVSLPEIEGIIYIDDNLKWFKTPPKYVIDFKNIDAWLKILQTLKKLS